MRLLQLLYGWSRSSLGVFLRMWSGSFGFLNRVASAAFSPLLPLLRPREEAVVPRGIKNLGNTCYVNSVLQALANIKSFTAYLENVNAGKHRNNFVMQLHIALKEIAPVSRPWFYFCWSFNPLLFLRSLYTVDNKYSGVEQHDAHEVLETIMRVLDDSARRGKKCIVSSPNPMEGKSSSLLRCCKCNWCRPMQDTPFCCLSLSIDTKHKKTSLADCLLSYVAPEEIDVECLQCTLLEEMHRLVAIEESLSRDYSSSCLGAEIKEIQLKIAMIKIKIDEVRSGANDIDDVEILSSLGVLKCCRSIHHKRLLVNDWPHILCLQLCRLSFDATTMKPVKIRTHVEFEVDIMLSKCIYGLSTANEDVVSYGLVCVIEHHGGAFEGHYTAYVCVDKKWYHISDDIISPVLSKEVLKAKAYLLFYERK